MFSFFIGWLDKGTCATDLIHEWLYGKMIYTVLLLRIHWMPEIISNDIYCWEIVSGIDN